MKAIALAAAVAALSSGPAVAQTHHHAHPSHAPATVAQASVATLADGEVRKVDKDAGKITLKHGPIVNLDMPGMTMVFRVRSPELLNAVKVGDAVKFHAESVNGTFTVTEIQPAP